MSDALVEAGLDILNALKHSIIRFDVKKHRGRLRLKLLCPEVLRLKK
jgi:hypothetical protein